MFLYKNYYLRGHGPPSVSTSSNSNTIRNEKKLPPSVITHTNSNAYATSTPLPRPRDDLLGEKLTEARQSWLDLCKKWEVAAQRAYEELGRAYEEKLAKGAEKIAALEAERRAAEQAELQLARNVEQLEEEVCARGGRRGSGGVAVAMNSLAPGAGEEQSNRSIAGAASKDHCAVGSAREGCGGDVILREKDAEINQLCVDNAFLVQVVKALRRSTTRDVTAALSTKDSPPVVRRTGTSGDDRGREAGEHPLAGNKMLETPR